MDAFKRCYSNNDTETVALPYFWEKFDKETMSIWHCRYNYPEELKMIFMTCNLVGGKWRISYSLLLRCGCLSNLRKVWDGLITCCNMTISSEYVCNATNPTFC